MSVSFLLHCPKFPEFLNYNRLFFIFLFKIFIEKEFKFWNAITWGDDVMPYSDELLMCDTCLCSSALASSPSKNRSVTCWHVTDDVTNYVPVSLLLESSFLLLINSCLFFSCSSNNNWMRCASICHPHVSVHDNMSWQVSRCHDDIYKPLLILFSFFPLPLFFSPPLLLPIYNSFSCHDIIKDILPPSLVSFQLYLLFQNFSALFFFQLLFLCQFPLILLLFSLFLKTFSVYFFDKFWCIERQMSFWSSWNYAIKFMDGSRKFTQKIQRKFRESSKKIHPFYLVL